MRPLGKPLNVIIVLSLSLAFGHWLTGWLSSWLGGFFQTIILALIVGTTIAGLALWARGALGPVQGLLQNPIMAAIAKTFAITTGLIFLGLVGYMLITTDADKYKDFILNRNFVLWVVILPMIATALLAIYAPVGIPESYRSAIPAGLKKLMWVALMLVIAFMYFFPDHTFTESVWASADKAKQKFADNILTPVQEKYADTKDALSQSKTGLPAKSDGLEKSDEPKIIYKIYIESPGTHWEPHPGYFEDKAWYDWAASSIENRESCRSSDWCQRAMRRLKEFGCLAPDNRLLSRCR